MYKIEEKRFLEQAIISNMQGLLSADWFVEHNPNYEHLTTHSKNLALEMLRQRNELFGDKEKINQKKECKKEVDFEEIVSIFNQVCFELPKVSKLTTDRENSILKILETYSTKDIGTVFGNVAQSDYLTGKKVEWKADFDWIFTPKNFIKILENKYKNIDNGKSTSTKSNVEYSDEYLQKIYDNLQS